MRAIAAMQPSQGQELPVVEKVPPGGESIAHRLPRVIAVFQGQRGQQDFAALELHPASCAAAFLVCRVIVGGRGQIFLGPVSRQHELAVKPEAGRDAGPRRRRRGS